MAKGCNCGAGRLLHIAHLFAALDCTAAAVVQALRMLQAAVLLVVASSTTHHLQCMNAHVLTLS